MKKFKMIMAAAVGAVMVCALAGCGGGNGGNTSSASATSAASEAAGGNDKLAQVKAAGKIVIGTEGTWAPWTFHDESDKLVGFDVEVGALIARELGVTAEFVEGEWDGLLAGVSGGRYDMVINGVEWSEDRAATYTFTEPYAYIRTALIVPADNTDITSFEDLKGKTTANSIGSTYMTLAEDLGATVQGVDSLEETLELVMQGRVDATLNAEVSFLDYMAVHPDAPLKVVDLTEEASSVVIPVKMSDDNASFVAAINEAIENIAASGELSELSVKYFGSDITK